MFSDEKDGALDRQRKLDFFNVKRAALAVGQHTREFFVSHTEELINMADMRITLTSDGVRVTRDEYRVGDSEAA
jgi:exonuclease SbcC